MVTLKPLACKSLPMLAEMMPFPSEETTPPVTKMYFVSILSVRLLSFCIISLQRYDILCIYAK